MALPTGPELGILRNPPRFPPAQCLVSQEQSDALALEIGISDELRPGERIVRDNEYPHFIYSTHGRAYSVARLAPYFRKSKNRLIVHPVKPRWMALGGIQPHIHRGWPGSSYPFNRVAAPLLLFNDAPDEKHFIKHIDGNPANNHLDNWCWISKAQLVAYTQLNGLISKKASRFFNVTDYGGGRFKAQVSLLGEQGGYLQIGKHFRSDYEAALFGDSLIRAHNSKYNLPLRQLLNLPTKNEIHELAIWLHIEEDTEMSRIQLHGLPVRPIVDESENVFAQMIKVSAPRILTKHRAEKPELFAKEPRTVTLAEFDKLVKDRSEANG
jgi:hypothetical protein